MSAFNEAYRAMVAKQAVCPRCQAENKPGASPTIEIDQTGTKGYCTSCSFARPVEAFLPRERP